MLGRKTGAGFYKYEGKGQTPNDQLVQWRVVAGGADPGRGEGSATTQPASPPPATAEELTHRLIFLMVNEAARCVEEGVVDSPEDADYGMILGTGFAPFRGGPLRFAEHFGLKRTVEELERLARTEEKFAPCEILKKHARDGTKFYE
jgi:3-hydroxyacyl-CoA dehydrogenase/enoyl-CoA hydratase/3-hydroxybutyryl-CoA epimerase